MDVRLIATIVVGVAACKAQLDPNGGGSVDARAIDGHTQQDAPPDAPLGAWSTPTPVIGASDPALDTDNETVSSQLTEMYFTIVDTAITGNPKQMWVMTRASATDPWGTPTRFAIVNTPVQTESPRLSPDDLTLYFGRNGNIFTTTRAAVGSPWSTPTSLDSVNTGPYVKWMAVCDNGYFLLSRANSPNGQDLYVGQLGQAGTIANELNSTSSEISSFLSKDCLTASFASNRSGNTQLYTATRTTPTSTFAAPMLVTEFGIVSTNKDLWLSNDGHTAFLATIRDGRTLRAVYTSTR